MRCSSGRRAPTARRSIRRNDRPTARGPDDIDALDPPHRRLFDHLQDLILDELPDAEIVFSYQIPMYKVVYVASG